MVSKAYAEILDPVDKIRRLEYSTRLLWILMVLFFYNKTQFGSGVELLFTISGTKIESAKLTD